MKRDLDPKLQADHESMCQRCLTGFGEHTCDDTESPAELEGEMDAEKATFEDVEPEETK